MIAKIQQKILTTLPGWSAQQRMAPPVRRVEPTIPHDVKQSAVCVLLFYKNEELHLILIKRTEDGKTHGGQISFPGGRLDDNDFSLTYCALRECEEEIALAAENIKVLGTLSKIYIPPSNFLVSPILCSSNQVENLFPSENEVAEIIEVPLAELFDDKIKSTMEVISRGAEKVSMTTPIYHYKNYPIWGATAMMLAELEEIYKRSL